MGWWGAGILTVQGFQKKKSERFSLVCPKFYWSTVWLLTPLVLAPILKVLILVVVCRQETWINQEQILAPEHTGLHRWSSGINQTSWLCSPHTGKCRKPSVSVLDKQPYTALSPCWALTLPSDALVFTFPNSCGLRSGSKSHSSLASSRCQITGVVPN